jgi:hypothetical protein
MANAHRTRTITTEVHVHGRECDRCGLFTSGEEVGGMAGFMAAGWESMHQQREGTRLDFCPACSATVNEAVRVARARPAPPSTPPGKPGSTPQE